MGSLIPGPFVRHRWCELAGRLLTHNYIRRDIKAATTIENHPNTLGWPSKPPQRAPNPGGRGSVVEWRVNRGGSHRFRRPRFGRERPLTSLGRCQPRVKSRQIASKCVRSRQSASNRARSRQSASKCVHPPKGLRINGLGVKLYGLCNTGK